MPICEVVEAVWSLRLEGRQHGGDGGQREIDLIMERTDQRALAIEVKLSGTVTDDDVMHIPWLREQVGDDMLDAVVINTGPQAYQRKDGVAVVPAALLGV
jgi:hypothetical protein